MQHKVSEYIIAVLRLENAPRQNRHEMAARRQDILHLDDARIAAWDLLWHGAERNPSDCVEQAPALFCESILALDALSPPLAEMAAGTELHQLFPVFIRPAREPVVIFLRCDPAGTTSGQECAIFANVDLGIGTIDFLADDTFPGEAGDLREFREFNRQCGGIGIHCEYNA